MTFTDPTAYSFVGAFATGAELDTYVQANMAWLAHYGAGAAPFMIVTVTTPIALETNTFVPLPGDTTILDLGGALAGGIFVAPVDGIYEFEASVSITESLGNKEARILINGDEAAWLAADNAYGAGSGAPSRRSLGQKWPCAAGAEVAPFGWTDAVTPGTVDRVVFSAKWVGFGAV